MFDLSTIKAKNRQAGAKLKKLFPAAAPALLEASKALHSQPLCSSPDVKIRPVADFLVVSKGPNGGLVITPTNKPAKALLKRLFAYSDDYRGTSVILKHRDWPSLLWLIEADGMTASRK